MNKLTDEKLLADLRSGDKASYNRALKYIYSEHYDVIAAYVKKNNGSDEEAADIFQDAIIAFYEKVRLGQLELNCSIRTYIYSVSKNLWFNRLRVQKRLTKIDDKIVAMPIEAESFKILAVTEENEMVMKLIDTLCVSCKQVLVDYYFNRLKMKEIATRMGFANEQVAKNKKAGCMKKLKNLVLNSSVIKRVLIRN